MSGPGDPKGEPIFLQPAPPPDRDALKERSASALERGYAFVRERGNDLDRLRVDVALRARPREDLIAELERRQRPDGSFERLTLDLSEALGFEDPERQVGAEITGTLDALALLGAERALFADVARRAEAFLRAEQNEDGSWGQPSAPADDRVFATGMLAGFLGRTRFVRPEVLGRAGEFLGAHWSPERVEDGRWSTLDAFAHFFTNVAHDEADAALQWCGRELERGFRSARFDGLMTARVLLDCEASALPGFGVEPVEILLRMLDEQAGDGGFAELAGGGAPARVGATLDGLRAVIALNAGI